MGGGLSFFLTNANCAKDLVNKFRTWTGEAGVGVVSISAQISVGTNSAGAANRGASWWRTNRQRNFRHWRISAKHIYCGLRIVESSSLMTQYLLKFKALRILLYVVAPLLVTRGLMLLWQQKILSGVESLGGMLIGLGVLFILYGWFLVGPVLRGIWGLTGEQEKQVCQIMCFEAGCVFTIGGILFLLRYSLN